MAANKALKPRHTYPTICGKNGSEFKCARMRNGSSSLPTILLKKYEEKSKPTRVPKEKTNRSWSGHVWP